MTMRKVAMPMMLLTALAAFTGLVGCDKRPAETMPQSGSPSTSTAPAAPASAASR